MSDSQEKKQKRSVGNFFRGAARSFRSGFSKAGKSTKNAVNSARGRYRQTQNVREFREQKAIREAKEQGNPAPRHLKFVGPSFKGGGGGKTVIVQRQPMVPYDNGMPAGVEDITPDSPCRCGHLARNHNWDPSDYKITDCRQWACGCSKFRLEHHTQWRDFARNEGRLRRKLENA